MPFGVVGFGLGLGPSPDQGDPRELLGFWGKFSFSMRHSFVWKMVETTTPTLEPRGELAWGAANTEGAQ